jgi:hypothetical protein
MTKNDQLFIQLIYIFQASGMQALGKLKNPITDKVEVNIEQAKQSIEILEMIKEKTKTNLSEHETRMLESSLSELRLNYTDVASRSN